MKLKSIVVEISRYIGSLNRMLDFFGGINARKKKGGISWISNDRVFSIAWLLRLLWRNYFGHCGSYVLNMCMNKISQIKAYNWIIKAAIYIKLKSFYCIWNEKIRIIGTKVVWQHYQSHLHTQLNHLWRIDFTSRIHYYLDLFHVIMTKMTVVKIGPETNCHQAKWILLEFFF